MTAAAVSHVIFRVDGHHKFGLGHLYRCLALALAVRQHHGLVPVFASLDATWSTGFGDILDREGIGRRTVSGSNAFAESPERTDALLAELRPTAMVVDLLSPDPSDRDLLDDGDLRFPPVPDYVTRLRAGGVKVAAITDEIDRIAIRADAVINSTCHEPSEDYHRIPGSRFHLGPDYFLMDASFGPYLGRAKVAPDRASKVLLIFGGSDHNYFTLRTGRCLRGMSGLDITAVLGPAVYRREDIVAEFHSYGIAVLNRVPSVAELMFHADLAVTTGGNTCYELASLGVPAVVLTTRERQTRNAAFFARQGTLCNLGLGTAVTDACLSDTLHRLIDDREQRQRMSNAGPRVVDGRGLARCAEIVAGLSSQ